jgi:peptide-methionine (R)-S-oxide reductase
MTIPSPLSRRTFLAATGATGLALGTVRRASSEALPAAPEAAPFTYEIQRSEAEWRAMLSEDEYGILREGGTEFPRTSDLWNETRDGAYGCRGCNLHVYSSNWKAPVDKGWVFFAHAEPDTVLMGIDGPEERYGMDPNGPGNLIEVHCRRCGSHLGHVLLVEGKVLHCINGTALTFQPAAT